MHIYEASSMFLLFLWPLQYWGLTKLHPIVMPVWVSECVSRGRYIFVLSAKSICRLRTKFHCTTSEINERETDTKTDRKQERDRQECSQEDAAARALMNLFMAFRQMEKHLSTLHFPPQSSCHFSSFLPLFFFSEFDDSSQHFLAAYWTHCIFDHSERFSGSDAP